MNILAVDQARNGAWAIYDYETKTLKKHGDFLYSKFDYEYPQAIIAIIETIEELIEDHNISAIFIEDISAQKNIQTFKKLAWLQGSLITYFEQHNYLYGVVTPSQWQNYCRARGRTTKEIKEHYKGLTPEEMAELLKKKKSKQLSIQFVKNQFGVHTNNDNLADAICIGYYVVNNVKILRK